MPIPNVTRGSGSDEDGSREHTASSDSSDDECEVRENCEEEDACSQNGTEEDDNSSENEEEHSEENVEDGSDCEDKFGIKKMLEKMEADRMDVMRLQFLCMRTMR